MYNKDMKSIFEEKTYERTRKKMVSYQFPEKVIAWIKRESFEQGISQANFILRALDYYKKNKDH